MDVEQFREDVCGGRIAADRLVDLIVALNERLQQANERIAELERRLAARASEKIAEPFSLRAEEKRQQARGRERGKRNRPLRRGRISTADKLALAARTEQVLPTGVDPSQCKLSHTRPVWRLENGRAVLVAYEIYRGPKSQFGKIPGVIGRSEFGLEIVLAIAYQVYIVGLSFDKVVSVPPTASLFWRRGLSSLGLSLTQEASDGWACSRFGTRGVLAGCVEAVFE